MEVTLSWQSKAIKQASLSERERGKTNDRSSGHTSQTAAKINRTEDTNDISSLNKILVGLSLLNQNIRLLYKSKQIRFFFKYSVSHLLREEENLKEAMTGFVLYLEHEINVDSHTADR